MTELKAVPGPRLYCNFCGKSQHEVAKLIAGPTVFICNECVLLCVDILDEEGGKLSVSAQREARIREIVREEVGSVRAASAEIWRKLERSLPEGFAADELQSSFFRGVLGSTATRPSDPPVAEVAWPSVSEDGRPAEDAVSRDV